jgi:chemotaxis methyl-accepting protein methylase
MPRKYHKLDILSTQFRDPSIVPSNITFRTQNILTHFPAEFWAKYDVVHVRFWVFALNKDDWAIAVKTLVSLLRPGGWIQWCDAAIGTLRSVNDGREKSKKYIDQSIMDVMQLAVKMGKDFR